MLSFYFNTSKETGCVQIQCIRIIGIVSEILGGNAAEEGIGIDFHIETGGNKNIDAAENRRSIDHAVTVDHRASEIAFEAAENRVELRAFKGFSVVIQCAAGKSGGWKQNGFAGKKTGATPSGWNAAGSGYAAFSPSSPKQKPAPFETSALAGMAVPQKTAQEKPAFQPGDLVQHKVFGRGKVLSVTPVAGDCIVKILFDKVGEKKTMANYAPLTRIEK